MSFWNKLFGTKDKSSAQPSRPAAAPAASVTQHREKTALSSTPNYLNQHELEALAKDGVIVSDSMMQHFEKIVTSMNAIGAHRCGSRKIRDGSGRNLIVDEYILPNGKPVSAGYVSSHS